LQKQSLEESDMAGDIEAVEKVVWTYLDGLYEGDTGKLAQAFHEVSHLEGPATH
jgi:hypothetical protein